MPGRDVVHRFLRDRAPMLRFSVERRARTRDRICRSSIDRLDAASALGR
jgi:hypothetical protein